MPHEAPPSALPGISPSRGEISSSNLSLAFKYRRLAKAMPQPISPLEGEMAGRPEGGVKERKLASSNRSYCAALISLTILE